MLSHLLRAMDFLRQPQVSLVAAVLVRLSHCEPQ